MKPYYSDSLVTLYHGDALDVLPSLPTASVGVVILDPPYSFESISVRGKDDGAAGTSGAPIKLLHLSFLEAQRLVANGGIVPVLHQWRRTPDVAYLMALAGLRLTSCVAWVRNRVGTGGLFRASWDPILVGSKGAPVLRDKAAVPNVIHVEPLSGQDHPYAKPPALWSPFISRVPSDAVVLDPYAGSGASAIAARTLGHQWIGIECDERFCEALARRLAQEVIDFGEAS